MLPEDLYQDLPLTMATWSYLDGSPLENDPFAWDVVMQLDFSGAPAVAGVSGVAIGSGIPCDDDT